MNTLAERLKQSRKEAGLSQDELATGIGKNQSIIGGLESGHRKTSSYIPSIASVLGVEPLWLAEGKGPKRRESSHDVSWEGKSIVHAPSRFRASEAMSTYALNRPSETENTRRILLSIEIGRQSLEVVAQKSELPAADIKAIVLGNLPFDEAMAALIGSLIRPDLPDGWLVASPDAIVSPDSLLDDGNASLRIFQLDLNRISKEDEDNIDLQKQPGVIEGWKISKEWAEKNIPPCTDLNNIRIMTGFTESMRGLFEPGDPIIVDTGIKELRYDGVYLFKADMNGVKQLFVKRLQRVPDHGIRVISQNKEYETFTISPEKCNIIGKVLKVWNSTVF
jgi:phage repressor protein C with HTH and peptisase S24 domain